jgi:NAD(P)-dependent dehydrogenase (short-subunit alcohol dehydrogenase family)
MSEYKKLALITGANSGIGLATAKKLLAQNYGIIVADQQTGQIKTLGMDQDSIRAYQVDLSVPDQVEAFCREISKQKDPIETLVNAAGYSMRGVLEEVPLADIRRIFEVNVFGLIRITQACLPGMRQIRRGTIVNVTSIAGRFTFPGNGPYAATKHAVEAFSDALRHEIAPFGIRVVTVRPAFIATAFNAVAKRMSEKIAAQPLSDYRAVVERCTEGMGKMWAEAQPISPDEVAALIVDAVLSENPHAAYAIGPMSEDFLRRRNELGDDEWTAFLDKKMGLENLRV